MTLLVPSILNKIPCDPTHRNIIYWHINCINLRLGLPRASVCFPEVSALTFSLSIKIALKIYHKHSHLRCSTSLSCVAPEGEHTNVEKFTWNGTFAVFYMFLYIKLTFTWFRWFLEVSPRNVEGSANVYPRNTLKFPI